ncbi:MAG TPA: hypothetical protein VIX19_11550 [Terriglobales bacterium]
MEKSYQLEQREVANLSQLEQERTQALAMIGALSLDMEQAKKNLDSSAERQKAFVRQALANRGIDKYENARTQQGTLFVSLSDPPPDLAKPEVVRNIHDRPNGPVHNTTE